MQHSDKELYTWNRRNFAGHVTPIHLIQTKQNPRALSAGPAARAASGPAGAHLLRGDGTLRLRQPGARRRRNVSRGRDGGRDSGPWRRERRSESLQRDGAAVAKATTRGRPSPPACLINGGLSGREAGRLSLTDPLGLPKLNTVSSHPPVTLPNCPASVGDPSIPAPSCPTRGLTGSADSPFVSVLPEAWHRSPMGLGRKPVTAIAATDSELITEPFTAAAPRPSALQRGIMTPFYR